MGARPEFRINPNRSVEIFGEINEDLANRVLPQIAALRHSPNEQEPITVYINSPGGSVEILDFIEGALNCQDQDGQLVKVITVVVGNAASAAADLLVFGDYAIGYAHSSIYFHGIRFSEVRQITAERAGSTSQYLRRSNLGMAYRLARSMMPRVVHRYAVLKGKFRRPRNVPDKELHELQSFVSSLQNKLDAQTFKKVQVTFAHIRNALDLSRSVFSVAGLKKGQSGLKQDEKVLRAVIRHEVQQSAAGSRLDEEGVSKILSDYLTIRDYHIGDHHGEMRRILLAFGVEFLTPREYTRFSKIPQAENQKLEAFLEKHAQPKLTLFWYFTVILCRNLLRGENPIAAKDAYWIGAIDEVVGKLEGRRLEEESDDAADVGITPASPQIPPGE